MIPGGLALLLLSGCAAASPPASQPSSPSATASSSRAASTTPSPQEPGYELGPHGDCDARQLDVTVASLPEGSGAGSFYWSLSFSNRSDLDCSLEGSPSVRLLASGTGEPVGNPSEPGEPSVTDRVDLPAGATVYSRLHLSQASAYGCPMRKVDGILVTLSGRPDAPFRLPTPDSQVIDGCVGDFTLVGTSAIGAQLDGLG